MTEQETRDDYIVDLAKVGDSHENIARRVGLSRRRVTQIVNRAGVTRKGGIEWHKEEIQALRDAGWTENAIAKKTGHWNEPIQPKPVTPAPAPAPAPAAVPATPPVVTKPPIRTARPHKQSRKFVEAYQTITRENPAWTVKQVATYLVAKYPTLTAGGAKFGHQDVGRLRMWATAPAPIREAYYDGKINAAAGETIMSGTDSKYLDDVDKINLVNKVASGLIGSGLPAIRAVMKLLPTVHGSLKARWLDPDAAMSYDELLWATINSESGSMGQSDWVGHPAGTRRLVKLANSMAVPEFERRMQELMSSFHALRGWMGSTAFVEFMESNKFSFRPTPENPGAEYLALSEDGWTIREIAALYGVNKSTVSSRLNIARLDPFRTAAWQARRARALDDNGRVDLDKLFYGPADSSWLSTKGDVYITKISGQFRVGIGNLNVRETADINTISQWMIEAGVWPS